MAITANTATAVCSAICRRRRIRSYQYARVSSIATPLSERDCCVRRNRDKSLNILFDEQVDVGDSAARHYHDVARQQRDVAALFGIFRRLVEIEADTGGLAAQIAADHDGFAAGLVRRPAGFADSFDRRHSGLEREGTRLVDLTFDVHQATRSILDADDD